MKTLRRVPYPFIILITCLLQAQTSRVELRSLSVPGIGSWQFNVLLPGGYDQSSQRYPVIYLFRGAVEEWMNRTQDASRGGRNIQDIADSLVAQSKMGNVILVMPGFAAMTGPATEADYAFVLNTLIPFIDQQYRTLPSRWFRGVDGFSLGGLHMVNLIWRNPERFASAGSYDGTVSMFDFNQVVAAGEPYFARIRPIQFLLHSAAVAPSNLTYNRQFEAVLNSIGIQNGFPDLLFSTTSQHNWWNADEHMLRSLPLHWSKFQSPPQLVSARFTSSLPSKVSGTVRLAWSIRRTSDSLKTLLEVSRDAGISWQALLFTSAGDTTFDWNTSNVKDGTRYVVRTRVFGDTTFGAVQSQRFTVDNPGNSPPDVLFLSPQNSETISGIYRIAWSAEDPEGDPVQTTIFGSSDNGKSWQVLAADVPNTGSYSWNSQTTANTSSYVFKIRCSDGSLFSEAVSVPVRLQNTRSVIQSLLHVSGASDAILAVNIVEPAKLTGHTYRVMFDDTSSAQKTCSILDVNRPVIVLQKTPYPLDGAEGTSFDGLRLSVIDPPAASINGDSTRWTTGSSTLTTLVTVPTIYTGTDTIRGIAYPSDYEIRIAGRVVDTSSSYLGSNVAPLYFSVWNKTENHRAQVVLGELDGDGRISRFDELYILEKNKRGQLMITWEIFFSGDDRAVLPAAGDVFTLKTIKPLRSDDMYEFTAIASGIAGDVGSIPRTIELSQNYPNPFNPMTTISYRISRLGPVELSIFDLLGRKISTLVQSVQAPGRYMMTWDATGLSSGLYFYKLTTDGAVITRKALLLK